MRITYHVINNPQNKFCCEHVDSSYHKILLPNHGQFSVFVYLKVKGKERDSYLLSTG